MIDEVSGVIKLNSNTATYDVLAHEISHVNFSQVMGKWKTGEQLSNFELNLMESIGYCNNVRKSISLGVSPNRAFKEYELGAGFAQAAIQGLRSGSPNVIKSYQRTVNYYGQNFVEDALRFNSKGLNDSKRLFP
jgi:hypothetical protein